MIRRLPARVVERIAAGEVVERPASVVKELLENALDAGATEVAVSIERGGLDLIRVADNGGGLPRADLGLAFAPHATSKLTDVDDLFHIGSFGFRGEALSSIAAVSRSRIESRAAADDAGYRVEASAGHVGTPEPVACAPGTRVEVRDLFFNTPARRRFLGAASTEAARCREAVTAASLVQPGVRFRFESDGRTRFAGEGAPALRDRVREVYGGELAEQLVRVSGRGDGLLLEGLLSLPAAARNRARVQALFVNGRPIRDRAAAAAVRSACQDFLPGSLHPSWILCVTIDPERVDVNVHPTKAELRFREPDALFRLLRGACRAALLAADLTPRVSVGLLAASWPPPAAGRPPDGSERSPARPFAAASAAAAGAPAASALTPAAARVPAGLPQFKPAGRFLQVLDTYLVHDSAEGLVLIDQHALHERILYARLQAESAAGRLPGQRLLMPELVRLEPMRYEQALAARDELARLGLELEPFGPDTVAITCAPAVLRSEKLADLLRDLLDPPDPHGGLPHGLDRRLFTMACHAAVKAGDPLGESEMADLLRQGSALEHDATCPHGRPTRLVVPRAELEKLFKRSGF